MRVSKKKINSLLKRQNYNLLYQVIADIKNPNEAKDFLSGFLSKDELEIVSQRLGIVYLLDRGKTYTDIKKDLGVSSTTISSIAREIKKKKGYEIALQKIKAEEWADKWTKKLTGIMKLKRR